jgi:hypothetical protein
MLAMVGAKLVRARIWRVRRCVLVGAMCWLAPSVSAAEGEDLGSSGPGTSHVYGGNKVAPCTWPTTVSLGGCTGTLVHPELVIYAAHCGHVGSIYLGDSTSAPGRTLQPQYCKTYPGGGPGNGTDWAFCKLSAPVTDVPITPPLMGC